MKHILTSSLLTVAALLFMTLSANAHCEIPCGIYDDKARVTLLEEHITTMEKSMGMIVELENKNDKNQLVRWVMNKEDHANQFQEIVSQYFLTQRIKKSEKNYAKQLETLHQMLVYAMKCKQTTDTANIAKLRELTKEFDTLYFAEH